MPEQLAPRLGEKLLLTMEEAAQVLAVGRNTIYGLALSGQIHSIKIGRLRRIPWVALRDFISQELAKQEVA